jgi:chorismate dehydratase
MGICSPGPVDSVLLFGRTPIVEARRVGLDGSSRTSAALCRLLFAEWLGTEPEFQSSNGALTPAEADVDVLLLIGDPALRSPRDGYRVVDLALVWRERTGLPFCFAAWVARDETCARAAVSVLRSAMERGLAHRGQIAAEASARLGIPADRLLNYLTSRITYRLGPPEEEGIALFRRLLEKHALL